MRWTDILNPKKKDTVKYYDSSLKERKRRLLSAVFCLHRSIITSSWSLQSRECISEVCKLDREDIDFEEFTVAARNTKNRVDRTVVVRCRN